MLRAYISTQAKGSQALHGQITSCQCCPHLLILPGIRCALHKSRDSSLFCESTTFLSLRPQCLLCPCEARRTPYCLCSAADTWASCLTSQTCRRQQHPRQARQTPWRLSLLQLDKALRLHRTAGRHVQAKNLIGCDVCLGQEKTIANDPSTATACSLKKSRLLSVGFELGCHRAGACLRNCSDAA